jgi:DNA repair photolyase
VNNIANKPVVEIEAPIINMTSGFSEKKLCDGPTFSAGTACVYKCSFCYVPSFQSDNPAVQEAMKATGKNFEDLVIRRKSPVEKLTQALTHKGKPKYTDGAKKVVFASPLVDVAATVELAKETAACCMVILKLTNWDIRLLSKSSLLPMVATRIPVEFKNRIIYGVSTGTFNDDLAKAFEEGTPRVTKRLESLYWLQDHGFRTYGMLCPNLPQEDYNEFAAEAANKIRINQCEHVWGEVLNVRGESMTRTCKCLRDAGFAKEATDIERVSNSVTEWEDYARATFNALTKTVPADKLRFLQYVTEASAPWWKEREAIGAISLGKHAITSL